jgi:hypothetical protein
MSEFEQSLLHVSGTCYLDAMPSFDRETASERFRAAKLFARDDEGRGAQSEIPPPTRPMARISYLGPNYAHDVRNVSRAPTVSIHAYSPPLREMNEYELDGSQLVPREAASERAEALDQEWRMQ